MAPIVQGQHFPSLHEFKIALRQWAIETNFTPAIIDSDLHRVRAGCRFVSLVEVLVRGLISSLGRAQIALLGSGPILTRSAGGPR